MPSPAANISGTLQNITGAGVASAVIVFTLCNFGDNPPSVAGTAQLAPIRATATTNGSGAWSISIYGNDQLSLSGTFYQVQVLLPGANIPAWVASYTLNSGTYDLSTQTPLLLGNAPISPLFTLNAGQIVGVGLLNVIPASTAPAHEFATAIAANGALTYSQPAFSDISGTASTSQIPTITSSMIDSSVASKTYVDTQIAASGPASATATYTTASLAAGATENGTVAIAKGFFIFKVVVNNAARVRLYQTSTSRTNDASRNPGVPPTSGTPHGVIGDWYLDGSSNGPLTFIASPVVYGVNNDSPQTTTIYVAITNIGNSTQSIAATISYVKEEI